MKATISKAIRAMVVLLLTALSLTPYHPAFGQGTVLYANTGVDFKAPVYGLESCDPDLNKTGNTTAGVPAGAQEYTAAPLNGPNFLAQFFGAAGADQDPATLAAATTVASFRTGLAAGYMSLQTATFMNIPAEAPVATLQLRVWDNSSGWYSGWANAQSGWLAGTIPAGMSEPFNVYRIGGGTNTPPLPVGLRSFNMRYLGVPGMRIQSHPTSQVVAPGRPATFQLRLDPYLGGSLGARYQWFFNGTALPGETRSSLTINNPQAGNAGVYRAMVTNDCHGAQFTSNATLSIITASIRVGGEVEVRFDCPAGTRYQVLGSSNLADWAPLGSFTNAGPTAVYTEPPDAVVGRRFYRVLVLD